jgi:ABC-type uncharacterized transport system substrate-binding protein
MSGNPVGHAPFIVQDIGCHDLEVIVRRVRKGLMSYGVDFPPMFRRTAEYVAKILQGAKPADLPIEQATKFEMVINLKTAKAIELPTSILLRADERPCLA